MLLAFALPQLASAVGDVAQVRVTEFLILTPPAVLGTLGLVGVVVVAVRWLTLAPPTAPPGPPPPPVSDPGGRRTRDDHRP